MTRSAWEGMPLNYIEQELQLETETRFGAEPPLFISAALLRLLNEVARPCIRMAIEGASSQVGAPPAWLERACDIRILGFSNASGSSVLHLKAPKLVDAVPELFEQQRLWPGPAGEKDTALQVIGRASHDIRLQETASELYDQPLLRHFTHWERLFKREVSVLHLPSASDARPQDRVLMDMKLVESARFLNNRTPSPRQVRVVGKLDMVRHSTRSFGLLLQDGEEVRGVLQDEDPLLLQRHFGQEITVLGRAVYRPSGSLLRIDAQEILDTTEGKRAFSLVPKALGKEIRLERKAQTAATGVAALFGTWPGEETDRDLLAALRELRG